MRLQSVIATVMGPASAISAQASTTRDLGLIRDSSRRLTFPRTLATHILGAATLMPLAALLADRIARAGRRSGLRDEPSLSGNCSLPTSASAVSPGACATASPCPANGKRPAPLRGGHPTQRFAEWDPIGT
jgi:hypothetical protein